MAYTDAAKADAVALYVEHGLAEAHRRTGIPKSTLQDWLTPEQRAEASGRTAAKTAAATEAHALSLEQRRLDLASDLMGDVQKIRAQLFAPCVERKAMVVSAGQNMGSEIDIVDIERDHPTFGDQQRIMTTLAIAVDKVQILTGQATERIEHIAPPERTPDVEAEMAAVLKLVRPEAA